MEENKNVSEGVTKAIEAVEKALVYVIFAAIIALTLGTLTVPAVLAFRFGWYWVFLYPALLILLVSFLKSENGKEE